LQQRRCCAVLLLLVLLRPLHVLLPSLKMVAMRSCRLLQRCVTQECPCWLWMLLWMHAQIVQVADQLTLVC
jgi:hypothetical protein